MFVSISLWILSKQHVTNRKFKNLTYAVLAIVMVMNTVCREHLLSALYRGIRMSYISNNAFLIGDAPSLVYSFVHYP
jgi:MFS-type transporter involved in bile tolerance (Atg22 family)